MESARRPRAVPLPSPARWRRGGWPLDVAVALGVGAVSIGGTLAAARWQTSARSLDALAFALLAVDVAALACLRRYPVTALLVLLSSTLFYLSRDYPGGPVVLPLFAAFVLQAEEALRVRRAYQHAVEQQDIQAARSRAAEQRLRMARELHDIVLHNISLIDIQAGVALHLMDDRPEQARAALAAIKQASKNTLHDLRSALILLRQAENATPPAAAAGSSAPPGPASAAGDRRAPEPRRAAPAQADPLLGDLATQASAAGLQVRTEVDGEPRPLPAGVDLAAFRIVQEALTNVARHARPATATVRVTYGEHDLIVEVSDDGRGEASGEAGGIGGEAGGTGGGEAGGETGERSPDGRPGGGNGIRDMRERAAAVGGRLEAGPRPGGGFRVRAQLPLDGPLWPGS